MLRKKSEFSAEKSYCRVLVTKKWKNRVAQFTKKILYRGVARIRVLWGLDIEKAIDAVPSGIQSLATIL